MSERKDHSMRNFIFNCMGVTLTLAGITYIAVQYKKLLSTLILESEAEDEAASKEVQRFTSRMNSRFKQVRDNDGVAPDVVEGDDISVDIEA